MTNQELILSTAEKLDDDIHRSVVLKKVTDKRLINEMAYTDPSAVKAVTDENILVDLAKNSSNPLIRRNAVNNISNESIINEIVRNDPDNRVRYTAVYKVTDDNVLIDVYNNDIGDEIRKAALRRISNQDFLKSVAGDTSINYEFRREQLVRLQIRDSYNTLHNKIVGQCIVTVKIMTFMLCVHHVTVD